VDFILGEKDLALEVKGKARVHDGDLGSLAVLAQDGPARKRIIVSLEEEPRRLAGGIEALPWRMFLDRLWGGDLGL
jgi:hypothetical protein